MSFKINDIVEVVEQAEIVLRNPDMLRAFCHDPDWYASAQEAMDSIGSSKIKARIIDQDGPLYFLKLITEVGSHCFWSNLSSIKSWSISPRGFKNLPDLTRKVTLP